MRTNQLHEKLIQPPRQLLADIIHHVRVGALWIIRDRFTPKVRAQYPEHWKAFQKECARQGFKFPRDKFEKRTTKGCSIQILKLEPEEMPDNYRHLTAENPEVKVLINWTGEVNTGNVLAYWGSKTQKLVVNACNVREFHHYPNSRIVPEDIAFMLRSLEESVTHELRHATQFMLLAPKDSSQIERLPNYADYGDDYYASPLEFDPHIGSAVHEFIEHYKMLTTYAKKSPKLALWFAQYVGAKPGAIGNGFSAAKFFKVLKKKDGKRYRLAVKKFYVALIDALKAEGLIESVVTESFYLNSSNQDSIYQAFKRSYEEETGKAWSEGKFLSRARNWTFYGDDKGFVAVREQRSGMKKLVGVAGEPKSILKGLAELQTEGGPIWGAVSAPLAQMAKKRGMIVPHLYPGGAFFIKALVKVIPSYVFGGYEPVVTKDGGVQFQYDDVGTHTKYLIGNKAYFVSAMKLPGIVDKLKEVPGLMSAIRLMGLSEAATTKDRQTNKFWIMSDGALETLPPRQHHYDWTVSNGKPWYRIFQDGAVRGTHDPKTETLNFSFTPDAVSKQAVRTMLRMIADHPEVQTIYFEQYEVGAKVGEDTYTKQDFQRWIRQLVMNK